MSMRWRQARITKDQDIYLEELAKRRQIDTFSETLRKVVEEHREKIGISK